MSVMNKFNFCTIFDYGYISRGLALYESLLNTGTGFCLYILALDTNTKNYLEGLKLENAVIIGMPEFEDEELLRIKPTRSKVEYYWTITPSIIKYTLDKYKLDSCTYLDGDLYFYTSPLPLFDEISGSSVGISLHNYSPEFYKSEISGRFCVQFVYFKNNCHGRKALSWWREECIKWCFGYVENGKFGDQKYLDYFEELFEEVHIIRNQGCGIAPWNIQKFKFSGDEKITGYTFDNISFPVIFYHFHNLKIDLQKKSVSLIYYEYSPEVINFFYLPYIRKLLEYESSIRNTNYVFNEFRILYPKKIMLAYLKIQRYLGKNMFIRRIYNIFTKTR